MGTWPNFVPRWGRLPVEQYLIRNWNHASPDPPPQQRSRLVHEYIHLDTIPKEWDPTDFGEAWYKPDPSDGDPAFAPTRIPTDDEIETILRPWRSQDLRKKAWEIWCDRGRGNPVMLRTYYGDGEEAEGDRKFGEYTRVSDTYDAVADVYALNNRALFDFGSDWRRVFEDLPEIAGCADGNNAAEIPPLASYSRWPDLEMLDNDFVDLAEEIQTSKAELPNWNEDPDILLEPGDTAIRSLLRTATISWIIIVDETTFKTDELLIVYFDMHQNVTVEGRLELDQGYIDEMLMRWENGGRPLGIVMENGTVGERYRLSSEEGRKFFRLSEDLEYKGDGASLS
ncbi:hypothetical protein ASPCAL09373 [Aspergillus calidoustus]|uniref:Uncharacterized protein n=1 Tax=Aspergillus calidoustus TaxID=454130 RepID=A0A0U5GSZ4_ASPCI|nr:hypothetical protein ASPCAL09373 [Aspergillus calidoustus]